MERRPPTHTLSLLADIAHVREMVKGLLHTIFFHRLFIAIRPLSRTVLSLTLPAVDDVDIESMINDRASLMLRQLESSSSPNPSTQIAVHFFEKKRKKSLFSFGKNGDEEVCWETWLINVDLISQEGRHSQRYARNTGDGEDANSEKMAESLSQAASQVIHLASEEKDHIPPITTTESNPFPYNIVINSRFRGS